MSNNISLTKSTASTQPLTKQRKVSYYRDLFDLYFLTAFKRGLINLYRPLVKDNIYILSNLAPFELLADKQTASYAVIDLSQAEETFKDLVREFISNAYGELELSLRLDSLMVLVNIYFGSKILPGEDLINTKSTTYSGIYPKATLEFDKKDKHDKYVYSKPGDPKTTPIGWFAGDGVYVKPIELIYKEFNTYLNNEKVFKIDTDVNYPKDKEFLEYNDRVIHYKPLVGLDVFQCSKFPKAEMYLLVKPVTNRAVRVIQVLKENNITLMLGRPNVVLFPYINAKRNVVDDRPT